MTATQDLFVGAVAVVLGSLLLAGAVINSATLMQLAKPKLLVERFGSRNARLIIAACGLAVIAMGGLIAIGWKLAW